MQRFPLTSRSSTARALARLACLAAVLGLALSGAAVAAPLGPPIVLVGITAAAAEPEAGASGARLPDTAAVALARKVQAFYEQTRDWRAKFTQSYTYAAANRTQRSRGTLLVKKPGKLRWDYAEPKAKSIVLDGAKLTQYDPEENQAYVDEHFDATAMSAAVSFLLGRGSLQKEFTLALAGEDRLVLRPRVPDGRVERIELEVTGEGEVTGTRVVDGSGNENALAFAGIRRNTGLSDAAFVIELPKDVQFLELPGR